MPVRAVWKDCDLLVWCDCWKYPSVFSGWLALLSLYRSFWATLCRISCNRIRPWVGHFGSKSSGDLVQYCSSWFTKCWKTLFYGGGMGWSTYISISNTTWTMFVSLFSPWTDQATFQKWSQGCDPYLEGRMVTGVWLFAFFPRFSSVQCKENSNTIFSSQSSRCPRAPRSKTEGTILTDKNHVPTRTHYITNSQMTQTNGRTHRDVLSKFAGQWPRKQTKGQPGWSNVRLVAKHTSKEQGTFLLHHLQRSLNVQPSTQFPSIWNTNVLFILFLESLCHDVSGRKWYEATFWLS